MIIRSQANNYLKTFIKDYIRYISNKTTVKYVWRFTERNQSVLDEALEMKLSEAIQAGQSISSKLQNE